MGWLIEGSRLQVVREIGLRREIGDQGRSVLSPYRAVEGVRRDALRRDVRALGTKRPGMGPGRATLSE